MPTFWLLLYGAKGWIVSVVLFEGALPSARDSEHLSSRL